MATHSSILPRKSHEQRSLEDYSLWDHKESDMTQQLNNKYYKQVRHQWCDLRIHTKPLFPSPTNGSHIKSSLTFHCKKLSVQLVEGLPSFKINAQEKEALSDLGNQILSSEKQWVRQSLFCWSTGGVKNQGTRVVRTEWEECNWNKNCGGKQDE